MKLTFITNSCLLIELKSGTTILCDPWLTDGIYEGAWANYPALKYRQQWLDLEPDYVYLSHIHPDHCDVTTLRHYPKDTPILIGKMSHRNLFNKISSVGFTDIREYIMDAQWPLFGCGFNITIHSAFSTSAFSVPDAVDYDLDTAITILDMDGTKLFNCNDNPINPAAAQKYVDKYGKPDIALLPCSGAGLYPQCMQNIEIKDKKFEAAKVELATIRNFTQTSKVLEAPITIPLSGQYKLIGRHAYLDKYIRRITPAHFHAEPITWLEEGDTVVIDGPVDMKAMMFDAMPRLKAKANETIRFSPYKVSINGFNVNLGDHSAKEGLKIKSIDFTLDPYTLIRIMQGKISWNEAEIGSHIMVKRDPDVYDKTIHSLMNFFRI